MNGRQPKMEMSGFQEQQQAVPAFFSLVRTFLFWVAPRTRIIDKPFES
jgi:hypothetical protein